MKRIQIEEHLWRHLEPRLDSQLFVVISRRVGILDHFPGPYSQPTERIVKNTILKIKYATHSR